MFIYTALEIGFKNTMLADLTPAEGETLYNAAIAFLEQGKYVYDVEGDLADGLENVRFSVFNICLSGCRRLATLMLQHTFLYRDLTKGPEWFAYSTKEASQEKLRANLQAMTLEQFHKLAYQHYRLFYRKAQTPLQALDGRMARLNQALLADEDVVFDAEIAMANREEGAVWATPYYTMIRYTVTPSYTYSVVDYENDGALVPLGKEVLEDADGEYYLDDENEKVYILEDGAGYYTLLGRVRTDLERVYSYSLDGVDVDESEVLYDADGGVYYTEERAEAFLFYYSPAESSFDENTLYEESAIETRYATTDGAPLTRYLTGVWHMMLTDPDTGEEMFTPVLEMTDLMDTMTVNINRATLLDLYVYEIFSSEPDVEIPESIKYDPDGGTNYVTNLNELTVSETINFVTYLVERIEMFG